MELSKIQEFMQTILIKDTIEDLMTQVDDNKQKLTNDLYLKLSNSIKHLYDLEDCSKKLLKIKYIEMKINVEPDEDTEKDAVIKLGYTIKSRYVFTKLENEKLKHNIVEGENIKENFKIENDELIIESHNTHISFNGNNNTIDLMIINPKIILMDFKILTKEEIIEEINKTKS